MSLTIVEPVKLKLKLTERTNLKDGTMHQEGRTPGSTGNGAAHQAVEKFAMSTKAVVQQYQEIRGSDVTREANFFCLMRLIILNMAAIIKDEVLMLKTIFPIVDNVSFFTIYLLDYVSDIRQTRDVSKFWGKIILCALQAIIYLLALLLTMIIMVVPIVSMVFTLLANIFYVVHPFVSK